MTAVAPPFFPRVSVLILVPFGVERTDGSYDVVVSAVLCECDLDTRPGDLAGLEVYEFMAM